MHDIEHNNTNNSNNSNNIANWMSSKVIEVVAAPTKCFATNLNSGTKNRKEIDDLDE